MTVKALIALILGAIIVIGFGVYFFNNYLFARVITPTAKNTIVSPGEVVSIPVGTLKTGASLKVELCSTGTNGCIPVAVGITEDPVRIRIPIGYQTGSAMLQIRETQAGQKTSRLKISIPLTVR